MLFRPSSPVLTPNIPEALRQVGDPLLHHLFHPPPKNISNFPGTAVSQLWNSSKLKPQTQILPQSRACCSNLLLLLSSPNKPEL